MVRILAAVFAIGIGILFASLVPRFYHEQITCTVFTTTLAQHYDKQEWGLRSVQLPVRTAQDMVYFVRLPDGGVHNLAIDSTQQVEVGTANGLLYDVQWLDTVPDRFTSKAIAIRAKPGTLIKGVKADAC